MAKTYKGIKKNAYIGALARLEALKACYESKSDGSSVVSMLNREIEELTFTLLNWDTLSKESTNEQENTD
tara:strand:- start:36537 stop:36746 length:210 start_codon:yes stop_codon:yes gene_type:complete